MVENFESQFRIADNLYKEGRYSDSINTIDEILNLKNINLQNKLETYYLKTLTLIKLKKLPEALELAEYITKEGEKSKNTLFQIDGFLAEAAVRNDLRELKESYELVDKAEKLLKNSSSLSYKQKEKRSSNLLRIKGWNFLYSNKLKDALECFEERLELCRKAGDTFELGVGLNDAGVVLMYLGESQSALKFYNQGLEIFKETGHLRYIANIYNNIAIIHYQRGELNQALEYSGKCLALREDLGEEYDISRINHQLGTIYSQLGNLDKALEHYDKSNDMYEKKGTYLDRSKALLDIHYVYKRKGEYELALDYLEKLLELSKENDDKEGVSVTYNYIGRINVERGELGVAEENYKDALSIAKEYKTADILADVYYSLGELYYLQTELKDSLKYHLLSMDIREKIGYPFQKAFSLKNLVSLHLDLDLPEKAKEYQEILKKLANSSENKIVKQISKFCEALLLKSTLKDKDKSKAEFLLEQLINEEIIDYQITVEALLVLTDVLLDELYKTSNEDMLPEINTKIERLDEIASKQGSFFLRTEISLLKSQLLLLNLDIEGALEVLSKAQNLAEEKGLYRVGLRLSNEYDNLLDKMDLWEKFTMRLPTIAEKMELVHIEEHLDKLIKRRHVIQEESMKEEEIPILISIFSEEGSVVLIEQLDESFSRELIEQVFQEIRKTILPTLEDSIVERVRLDEYSYLLLKENDVVLFYLFIGKSYLAIKKLKQFTKLLLKNKKLKLRITDHVSNQSALNYEDRINITELIDKIFIKK